MSPRSFLLLPCLLYRRAHAFETTVCDCAEPLNMGIVQFPDADCQPKMNTSTAVPVRYVIYRDERTAEKFPGFICARWKNVHRVTMNFFGQLVTVPEKIPMDTTATECYNMINNNLLNHMNVMADIVAAINEHPPSDFSSNHHPSVSSVLLTSTGIEKYTSWWEIIKISLTIAFISIFILIVLRIGNSLGFCKTKPKSAKPSVKEVGILLSELAAIHEV